MFVVFYGEEVQDDIHVFMEEDLFHDGCAMGYVEADLTLLDDLFAGIVYYGEAVVGLEGA
jgi:hypothetical protein